MRVLFVVPPLSLDTAMIRYRCGHLAEALRRAGHEADVVRADATTISVQHDVVVAHRLFWGPMGHKLRDATRQCGAAFLYGVDDLIFAPDFAYHVGLLHPDDPTRYCYHRGEVEWNRATLLAADGVLVSTDFLATQVCAAFGEASAPCPPLWTVRNFPGDELRRLSETAAREASALRKVRQDDRVTLGYLSGSPTHDADFADIAGALANVLRAHPQARLLVVGTVAVPNALQEMAAQGRVQRHPPVPWRDLPRLLAGIDINLAPLDPTRAFVHAKSEVKWLEASLVGVPTLAGWAAGFAEAVKDSEDCLLARTTGDWETALTRLITDADLRTRLADSARITVTERADADRQATQVAEVFAQAAAATAARAAKPARPNVVLRRPAKEKARAWFKEREAGAFRTAHRLKRHWRLLRDEVSR